jgi:hypothetical protein
MIKFCKSKDALRLIFSKTEQLFLTYKGLNGIWFK